MAIESPAQVVTSVKRVPLMEIPVNTPNGIQSTIGEFSSRSELINVVSVENECVLDSFTTPIKQPECLGLTDCFSTPSLLDDDDFDESILKEIDAICEEKSAAKAEKQTPNGNGSFQVESKSNEGNCTREFASLESVATNDNVRTEGALDIWDDLESITKDKDASHTIQCGNMPEDYSKYVLSLNDRQREAACSDISIPLMLVAGPGSGKVFLSSPYPSNAYTARCLHALHTYTLKNKLNS